MNEEEGGEEEDDKTEEDCMERKLCKQKKEYVHVQHIDSTRKKDMSQILPMINIPTPLL